jgi:hypothetical protein
LYEGCDVAIGDVRQLTSKAVGERLGVRQLVGGDVRVALVVTRVPCVVTWHRWRPFVPVASPSFDLIRSELLSCLLVV